MKLIATVHMGEALAEIILNETAPRVILKGKLTQSADRFKPAIHALVTDVIGHQKPHPRILMDCSQLTYIDSMSIAACIAQGFRLFQACEGWLVITRPSAQIQRAFRDIIHAGPGLVIEQGFRGAEAAG